MTDGLLEVFLKKGEIVGIIPTEDTTNENIQKGNRRSNATMNGDKLTPAEVKTKLFLCMDSGYLRETAHFKMELTEEKVSFNDSKWVLENGWILDPAEWDDDNGEWKYRIEGYEPDGKWLVIIFSFSSKLTAKLITVFSGKPRIKPEKRPL